MEERVYNNTVGVSRRGGVKRVMGEYQTTLIVSTPCTGAHYKLVYKTFTETTIVLFGRYNVKKKNSFSCNSFVQNNTYIVPADLKFDMLQINNINNINLGAFSVFCCVPLSIHMLFCIANEANT